MMMDFQVILIVMNQKLMIRQCKKFNFIKYIIYSANNKNLTILRTNLIFGTRSYFIRYLTQNFLENIDAINNPYYKNFRFHPL